MRGLVTILIIQLLAQFGLSAYLIPIPFGHDVLPGKYIVALKRDVSELQLFSLLQRLQSTLHLPAPRFTYNLQTFKGFSLDSGGAFIQHLLNFDEIDFIEPEHNIQTMAVQPDAPYGLARLSHRDRGASEYVYDDVAGDDTFSYIVDSGIFVDHPEFEGRASFGANFVGDGNDDDGNGHGTHCAGTVGSRTYGVAKKTNLIAVKVMNAHGGGGSSQLLAGIDWATRDVEEKGRSGKSVANLSVGGPRGQALNRAVQAATEQGLAMFVAAGNSGQPAASFSPSSEKTACVVGAIDEDDARPSFSNYGPELAVFAPGVEIMSTWKDGGTMTLSGTSMATPHIAGLGAYLLSLGPQAPSTLCQQIRDSAEPGVSDPLSSPDRIAFNGAT